MNKTGIAIIAAIGLLGSVGAGFASWQVNVQYEQTKVSDVTPVIVGEVAIGNANLQVLPTETTTFNFSPTSEEAMKVSYLVKTQNAEWLEANHNFLGEAAWLKVSVAYGENKTPSPFITLPEEEVIAPEQWVVEEGKQIDVVFSWNLKIEETSYATPEAYAKALYPNNLANQQQVLTDISGSLENQSFVITFEAIEQPA